MPFPAAAASAYQRNIIFITPAAAIPAPHTEEDAWLRITFFDAIALR